MASLLQAPVSEAANALLAGRDHIRLLEAGCGSASQIRFNAAVHVVGIDIAPEELEKNRAVQEKILGDIQDYPLPEAEFDVVVCWMVLEHLPRPRQALVNMFRAAKPGGIVILGFPNLASIKGLVTKFTPFWFHNVLYRSTVRLFSLGQWRSALLDELRRDPAKRRRGLRLPRWQCRYTEAQHFENEPILE
jgi:ubiquinone/menaquinone biosynthesis C-methylase UbiE